LFYNDVSIHYTNSKTQKVLDFAIAAKKEGILDGIGHQMHTSIGMDMGEWRRNLKRWVETGLLIHISEMDVEIGSNIMTPELAEKQSKTYQDVISITVTSVPPKQLWGIKTWGLLNGGWFKNAGKKRSEWKDLPLLFDEYGQRSQAYNDLLKKFSTN
jgi:endo-1,4-beta-xylanase